jgi:hypothetical protein
MKVEIRESQRSVLARDLCKPPVEFEVIQVQPSNAASNPHTRPKFSDKETIMPRSRFVAI